MAGFGFVFWLINAKIFTASDIGIATAIIPTVSMIAIGSLFGLDNSIVKFINAHGNRGELVRSTFVFVTLLSIIGSILFGLLSILFSPTIHGYFLTGFNYLVFVSLTITTTLNLLCDSIYLAKKKTSWTLFVTTFHSILKAAFPFLFINYGATGILLAATLAQLIGLIINVFIINNKWHYFSSLSISFESLNGIWKYTTYNYLASLLSMAPYCIVPIIVINRIGTSESAYYYIVTMIANLMYTISGATTKSLFAEGSHDDTNLGMQIRKSSYFIFILIIPAIIILFLFAKFILGFFGEDYANSGTVLLKILGLSTIPYAIYSITIAIFRIKNKPHFLLFCTAVLTLSEISLTYVLIDYGLKGIGLATLSSMMLAAAVGCILVFFTKTSDK